jgi:hypothetical protein
MMIRSYKLPLVLILVLFAGDSDRAILAQRVTMTRVAGVVKDNSGGVLPNVIITFRTRKLQKRVTSRSDGSFVVDLPEDTYRVGAKIGGCHGFKRNQFETRAGETINLDITLKCAATPIRSDSTTISVGRAEQIVGRERNQRACHRQLVRNAVVSRRVNSTVRAHRYFENTIAVSWLRRCVSRRETARLLGLKVA